MNNFKEAMARFATGVTVVSTFDKTPAGMTVSAFASVSLEPALVSICIGHQRGISQAIKNSGHFAVNILEAGQQAIGQAFANHQLSMEQRFLFGSWQMGSHSPVLQDCLAWVACKVHAQYVGGDHTIFLGEVMETQVSNGRPLIYHMRDWHRLA